jgi:hypothetical protein
VPTPHFRSRGGCVHRGRDAGSEEEDIDNLLEFESGEVLGIIGQVHLADVQPRARCVLPEGVWFNIHIQ